MAFLMRYSISPRLGVDLALKGTTRLHPLGTKVEDNYGRTWIYIKAGGTIPVHNLVKTALTNTPYDGVLVGTASATGTYVVGIAHQALASGDYAWIIHKGVYQDQAEVASGAIAEGDPFTCDASGGATAALAADVNNAAGVCLVDLTGNVGTLILT